MAKKAMYGTTPEKYAASMKKKFFDPHIKDEPVPVCNEEQTICFWGSEYNTDEVMKLLQDPPRPVFGREQS